MPRGILPHVSGYGAQSDQCLKAFHLKDIISCLIALPVCPNLPSFQFLKADCVTNSLHKEGWLKMQEGSMLEHALMGTLQVFWGWNADFTSPTS